MKTIKGFISAVFSSDPPCHTMSDGVSEAPRKRKLQRQASAEEEGRFCDVCSSDYTGEKFCVCPNHVRRLAVNPLARFIDPVTSKSRSWLRLRENKLSCVICQGELGKDGTRQPHHKNKFFTGEVIAGVRLGKDKLVAHDGGEKSDHKVALRALIRKACSPTVADEAREGGLSRQAQRERVTTPNGLINSCLGAYVCMKLPTSQSSFSTIADLLQDASAGVLPDRYKDEYMFTEFLSSVSLVTMEQIAADIKAASELSLHVDHVDEYLIIRLGYLDDATGTAKTRFWQARKVPQKTAAQTFAAIKNSFRPPYYDGMVAELVPTWEEVLSKLVALVADGASEMGVRRSGQSVSEAKDGENLFAKLQDAKTAVCPTAAKILGFWCSSHRLDLVGGKPELIFARAAEIQEFLKAVCGHIAASPKARQVLDFIARLMDEDTSRQSASSLGGIHFAPQRWLSSVKPMRALVTRRADLVLYMKRLQEGGAQWAQVQWINLQWARVSDLRFSEFN